MRRHRQTVDAIRRARELGAAVLREDGEWVVRAPGLDTVRQHYGRKDSSRALVKFVSRLEARSQR